MTTHSQRKHVPHRPEAIYSLVADIERYPEFLPWCTKIRVLNRREEEDGIEIVDAEMHVRFKMFRERFKSRVKLNKAARRIDIAYIDGPFRYLENRWLFEENPDGSCTIDFYIDFEFKSRALQMLISAVFGEAVKKMVSAFDVRADQLYERVT